MAPELLTSFLILNWEHGGGDCVQEKGAIPPREVPWQLKALNSCNRGPSQNLNSKYRKLGLQTGSIGPSGQGAGCRCLVWPQADQGRREQPQSPLEEVVLCSMPPTSRLPQCSSHSLGPVVKVLFSPSQSMQFHCPTKISNSPREPFLQALVHSG